MDRNRSVSREHRPETRRRSDRQPRLDDPAFVYRGGSIDSDAWSTRRGRGGSDFDPYEDDSLSGENRSGEEEYRRYRFAEGDTPGEIDRSARSDEEQRPIRGPHYGKGPKGYVRSDERIRDDVNERLYLDDELDASEIEVSVDGGVVTLRGAVPNRFMKGRAEGAIESVTGVRDVQNQLRIGER